MSVTLSLRYVAETRNLCPPQRPTRMAAFRSWAQRQIRICEVIPLVTWVKKAFGQCADELGSVRSLVPSRSTMSGKYLYMLASYLRRWDGPAAMLGGALLILKGALILVSDADPSLVPPATLLFALAMVGLHARLNGLGGPLGAIGAILAWVAVAASVVNLGGLVLGISAPGDALAPMLLQITYMVAFLGILVGLLMLGITALRAGMPDLRWRTAPLAIGVLWFPLQGIGFAISDGVGLVLGGLAWVILGYVLRSASSAPEQGPRAR
jgi:hypothetical protein